MFKYVLRRETVGVEKLIASAIGNKGELHNTSCLSPFSALLGCIRAYPAFPLESLSSGNGRLGSGLQETGCILPSRGFIAYSAVFDAQQEKNGHKSFHLENQLKRLEDVPETPRRGGQEVWEVLSHKRSP